MDQQKWESLFGTGLISEAEASTWASEVWQDNGDDQEGEEE